MRSLERSCESLGHLARAHCHGNEHGCGRRSAQQRAEQLDRCRIRPVEVVEHEYERPRLREKLEERTHCSVRAIALVLQCDDVRGREPRHRGEDLCELRQDVLVQMLQAIRVEPTQVLVECIDENRERKVSLELRRGSCKDEPALRIGATGELCEQAALPDPGLAYELDRSGIAAIDLGEDLLERPELLGTSHELMGKQGHSFSNQRRSGSLEPEIRVAPRCQRGSAAAISLHGPLLAGAPPRAARVRCRLCLLQGARKPTSPAPDARLVPLRRTRDLVDGRSATEQDALGLLPPYVADRTTATSVSEVDIP